MPSNFTENYQLSQWEASDQVLRADFNADNAKIDAALAEKGNCRIVTGSYTGDGTYGPDHPCVLTFERKPMIIFLAINQRNNYNSIPEYYILFRDSGSFMAQSSNGSNQLTWEEKSVSWYASYISSASEGPIRQFNEAGKEYRYIALLI